jgi:hypothetical protein
MTFRKSQTLLNKVSFFVDYNSIFCLSFSLNDPSDDEDFERLLEELFESFIMLGMETEVHLLPSQCAMLRYLPEGLEDILDVVDTRKLR